MRAEIAKVRYLPLPRWTALAVAVAVIALGIILLLIGALESEKYVSIAGDVVNNIATFAAIILGVWISTLEFGAGTMQRTLTAEPKRSRVLTDKLVVLMAGVLIGGLFVAAASGGLVHIAGTGHHVTIDNGELAATLFGAVPSWIAGGVVGFGAGLLTRSFGGGIAIALVFVLVLGGIVSFVPPLKHLSYTEVTSDMTNRIGGIGNPHNGLGVAIIGTVIWCLILVVPGWVRFLRGDLK
jgi:ABC-2 type transport system permease protein